MKLALMPRQLTWWLWLVTLAMMGVGLAGYAVGFVAAMVLTFAHTLLFWRKTRDVRAISVQIRLAYALLLALCLIPQLRWFNWLSAVGAGAMLVFGYCAMGRTLSLLPWNRTEPLSLNLIRRTFFTAPVVSWASRESAGCGEHEGVCELEARVATLHPRRVEVVLTS
jgi:hypothetical protein